MKRGRRILAWIAGTGFMLLLLAGISAWTAWSVTVRRITANEHAPHLTIASNATPAPDLTFETLDGRQDHLAAHRGKVVLLDLWGTWCIQCVAEMPSLQQLYSRYRNDPEVEFLVVSRMDTPARVNSYSHRNHLDLPFFVTRDADIPTSMQLHQFPSTFIIDKRGKLVVQHVGAANWSAPSVSEFLETVKRR